MEPMPAVLKQGIARAVEDHGPHRIASLFSDAAMLQIPLVVGVEVLWKIVVVLKLHLRFDQGGSRNRNKPEPLFPVFPHEKREGRDKRLLGGKKGRVILIAFAACFSPLSVS